MKNFDLTDNDLYIRFLHWIRYLQWQRKVIKQRKKFPPGSFLNCCGTKYAIVIGFDDYDSVDYWDIEHTRFGSCSLMHCGPERMTLKQVEEFILHAKE